ncbi:DUF3793 family protein [Sporohalobacter salinus]|uniref:DUF3793 family protein n=1 Tax=Sporohalobacter salinus TaxID=1494606 RepID=UPI0019601108|nr:DUF3793 family protein [Sporohalobacter salinus]MBM7624551.1 hypothetical protein [Sporohalobacter salinus]
MDGDLNKKLETNFKECLKCILKNIGATVVGVKPAELRTIKSYNGNYNIWDKCKTRILSYKEIDLIEVNKEKDRKKILFYHKSVLDEQLSNLEAINFLVELGYPKEYDLKTYLDFLVARLKEYNFGKRDFPHEIGIFLGYPLKDVLGFMGYSDLECTCKQEWKIYGDKDSSLLQKKRFDLARDYFNRKLEQII